MKLPFSAPRPISPEHNPQGLFLPAEEPQAMKLVGPEARHSYSRLEGEPPPLGGFTDSYKGQRVSHSAYEALLNILLGFGISVGANLVLLPLWGYQVGVREGLEIGLAFTLVSFVRSFLLRRLFNYFHVSKRGG